jgi:chorismate mutase
MTSRSRSLFALLLLAGVPAGCTAPSPPPDTGREQAIDDVLQAMQRRLLLMHDVARWKWNRQRPVADAERERASLEAVDAEAARYDLDPDFARTFFRAQIEAAKLVQQADFDRWREEKRGPFANVADLVKELRPRIDGANDHLLKRLAEVRLFLRQPEGHGRLAERAREVLTGEGITDEVRDTALAPLK